MKTWNQTKTAALKVVSDYEGKVAMPSVDTSQFVDRLMEIQEEIGELAREARNIVHRHFNNESGPMDSYWYPHIVGALGTDNEYLGGSMMTMQETIDAIQNKDDEEE